MKTASRYLGISFLLILLSGFQLIKTTLQITVRDGLGNIVEGATVQIFETEDDYLKEENVVAEGTTDKNGKIRFKDDLKAIAYYVIVRKDDKDNSWGGERTGELEERRINKVTIVIQ